MSRAGVFMISCKSPSELQRMRAANGLVAQVLGELREIVDVGVTTRELDAIAEDRVRAAGAIPAFKGYHGYPATLCTSVNEQVVHGIPSARSLRDGDIVSIDLGVVLDEYYGDAAVTLPVGSISEHAEMLLHVTEQALARSIAQVRLGGHVRIWGTRCSATSRRTGTPWCGSSSGTGSARACTRNRRCRTTASRARGTVWWRAWSWPSSRWSAWASRPWRVLRDGWTAVTCDGSLAAHFEHSVAVTADGPLVLSRPLPGAGASGDGAVATTWALVDGA